jgi:hypothetical protein
MESSALTDPPTLAKARVDNELPMCANHVTDADFPTRHQLLIEIALPFWRYVCTDNAAVRIAKVPAAKLPHAENPDAKRMTERIDKDEPA